jgi:phenylalanyl-tRNA synthetase alpha subunit
MILLYLAQDHGLVAGPSMGFRALAGRWNRPNISTLLAPILEKAELSTAWRDSSFPFGIQSFEIEIHIVSKAYFLTSGCGLLLSQLLLCF